MLQTCKQLNDGVQDAHDSLKAMKASPTAVVKLLPSSADQYTHTRHQHHQVLPTQEPMVTLLPSSADQYTHSRHQHHLVFPTQELAAALSGRQRPLQLQLQRLIRAQA